ncbi:MAG: zf-HC2 domain-containing protein [Anaerolineales bacterium]
MNHKQPPTPSSEKDHLSETELHAYLDNELSLAARERAGRHLAACSQCREALDKLEGLFHRLEEIPELPLREDLSNRILDQIKSERDSAPALPWIAALQAALAAALLPLTIPTLLKSPFTKTLVAAWSRGILFTQGFVLEEVGAWYTSLQALRDQIATTIRSGIHLPSPFLHFAPLWSLFLFAALVGILGNALLLRSKNQVPNGNHT